MKHWITALGYEDVQEFFIKFALPVLGGAFAAYFILLLFNVPWWMPYIFLLAGIGFVFIYPFMQYEKKKIDIHENIHLFITYAGTISTLDINRAQFFKHMSRQEQYGVITKINKKILHLAKDWNLGFAMTCRKMAKFSPSRIFADFLDRLAAVLDFGEDLSTFLTAEQKSIMDEYENEYKQSLENIKTLQDVFISLTIAIAFALSAALLIPLLMGISVILIVQYGLVAVLFIDVLLIIMITLFIPQDRLYAKLKIKDEGTKRIRKYMYYCIPSSIILFGALLIINVFGFLINVTIASFPMFIVGVIALQEENTIFERDKAYPAFIRAVGSTIYVRGGGITSALGSLQIHDFGPLQKMSENLYRRLRLGSDKVKSWLYFTAETGSNLIHYFTEIFRESIYLGGNGEKIGVIISNNFSRILGLRKLRLQLASGMRGALYGGLVGFVVTIYMAAAIVDMLSQLFSGAFQDADAAGTAAQIFSQVLPPVPEVDMGKVTIYIGIMVIIHAVASSWVIKVIDGGKKEAIFFDISGMLLVGSILSWVIPKLSAWAFGNILLGG